MAHHLCITLGLLVATWEIRIFTQNWPTLTRNDLLSHCKTNYQTDFSFAFVFLKCVLCDCVCAHMITVLCVID